MPIKGAPFWGNHHTHFLTKLGVPLGDMDQLRFQDGMMEVEAERKGE